MQINVNTHSVSVINKTKGSLLCPKVRVASTFISRMIGLLNRSSMGADEGLIITRCNSIHMFFMRFPIDAIFIDRSNHVVALCKNLRPFQLSPIYFKASFVLEFACGKIDQKDVSIGDEIQIIFD